MTTPNMPGDVIASHTTLDTTGTINEHVQNIQYKINSKLSPNVEIDPNSNLQYHELADNVITGNAALTVAHWKPVDKDTQLTNDHIFWVSNAILTSPPNISYVSYFIFNYYNYNESEGTISIGNNMGTTHTAINGASEPLLNGANFLSDANFTWNNLHDKYLKLAKSDSLDETIAVIRVNASYATNSSTILDNSSDHSIGQIFYMLSYGTQKLERLTLSADEKLVMFIS